MPVTNLGFLYFNPSPVPGLSLSRSRSIFQSCAQKEEASFLPGRTQGMEYDQPDRNRLSCQSICISFESVKGLKSASAIFDAIEIIDIAWCSESMFNYLS